MTMTINTTPPGIALVPQHAARRLTVAGAALTVASTFLAWTYTDAFPGDLTVYGYPGGLQVLTLISALLTLLFATAGYGVEGLGWLNPAGSNNSILLVALGTFATTWFTTIAISVKLGGLANLEPGGFVSLVLTVIATLDFLVLTIDQELDDTIRSGPLIRFVSCLQALAPTRAKDLPNWAEILIIAGAFGVALHVFTYGIDTEYAELFIGYIISVAFGFTALTRAGLIARITRLTTKHRNVTLAAALIAAFCFPFTQQNEQYALIGANILIFATVALGLNVVVGLAGLLDLGYVAFLGVGAYAAALVSGSPLSPVGVQFPFWAAVLTGAAASLVFGVVIGAPTLRLRGDYLAIVTLGFGEIFRLTVNALNGVSGPDLTNGSQGIPSIPDLNLFGFDFGVSHDVAGFTLGRSANYYLLMLVFTAVVVLVFRRSGESRIGRAWVAIREDETAATAMGINAFRLKLLAFALGATLAGLAGTVQAHVSYTVTPEQYQFAGSVPPNSAFLLAAVILGGMGTLSGPLVGAALLYLIPAKLQFMQDYQLFLFGIALILLMRFRPEGLVADRRKQLEFHETGQLDVPPDIPLTDQAAGTTKAGA
ncbi:branched-chain amino acid ABC transporter permease [Streptomyces anulatus]|uniref:branched-chain amino acid ABC transporter permease n=1 Tax=Streptomyces anulatus TaxID=1892 RepID=UPI00255CFA9F|nr:branched-chain amino acid ABC transporter permease [Streptomyces anulatus]WIY75562.1 branched-chain amino acid ABC transporter permease [Streptomyces anulatus]